MAKQFLKECKETRDDFVKVAGTYNISDNLELRTEIDSLLIMYDQLCERVRLADVNTGENNALLPDVSRWACCSDCKHFKHEILEDEDSTRCEKFEIDIEHNIYEKTKCSWFQPCG